MLIAAASLAIATVASAADIYKCPTAAGKFEFRDTPCQGVAGEKLKAKDNSAGTGNDLAGIRAQDAELKARLTARQAATDRENAAVRAANERAFRADQAHRDSVTLTEAIREGNAQTNADWYNSNLVRQRERKIKVEITTPPSKPPPKSLPAK
jgi:hypothetical protein